MHAKNRGFGALLQTQLLRLQIRFDASSALSKRASCP